MIRERLEAEGIYLRNYIPGEHSTTCSTCSPDRKKDKVRCLSVKVEPDGATWKCNHCDRKGGFKLNGKANGHAANGKLEQVFEFQPLPPAAREHLQGRGLDPDLAGRLGVRYLPKIFFPAKLNRHSEALVFAYGGKDDPVKFRAFPDKDFVQAAKPKRKPGLYGLKDCDPAKGPLVICEGELDRIALVQAGVANAVSVLNGTGDNLKALELHRDRLGRFPGYTVAVDGDAAGVEFEPKLLQALARLFPGKLIKRVKWPKGFNDPNAVLRDHMGGALELLELVEQAEPVAQAEGNAGVDAEDLLKMEFAPMRWVMEPYLVEGVTVLAGRPKKGKSWLTLGWAVDLAQGSTEVLYMGLEDNLRRLQKRLKAVLQGSPLNRGLRIFTQWRKLDDGGLDELRQWLGAHKDCRLVIIDTLEKVRPRRSNDADPYEADYTLLGQLKAVADEFSIAIVIVHHTRKADAADFVDAVAGSTGLTGAADTVLVLQRDRGSPTGFLKGVGRDLESEIDDAISFDEATGRWSRLGDADEYRQSESRREVLFTLRSLGPLTPTELAEAIGKERSNIQHQIKKLYEEGFIMREGRGKYRVIDDPEARKARERRG